MTTVTHLPGCNMPHDCGNWATTCRARLVITQPGLGTAVPPEQIATITVSADGPCSGTGSMEISIEFDAFNAADLDRFQTQVWAEIQQAIAAHRDTLTDWSQRSQCQHPEDQPCPE